MNTTETYFKLLDKTVNFISYRPRSLYEVNKRLDQYFRQSKNINPDVIPELKNRIITELQNTGLLDDKDFAKRYVTDLTGSRKKLSKAVIKNKLLQKGIARDIAEEALSQAYAEDPGMDDKAIEELIAKKLKSLSKYDKKTAKIKIFKYLLSKGFSGSQIYSVFDSKFNNK